MRSLIRPIFILVAMSLLCSTAAVAKKTNPSFFIEGTFKKLEKETKDLPERQDLQDLLSCLNDLRNNNLTRAQSILDLQNPPPEYTDLYDYGVAAFYIARGKPTESRPALERLLQKHPEDPDIVFLQSRFLAESDNLLGAIDALDINLTRKQKIGETYLQRGLLNTTIFNYEGALKDFRKALQTLEKSKTAFRQITYFQMGLIELKYHGNETRAAKLFREGKNIAPESPLVEQLEQSLR